MKSNRPVYLNLFQFRWPFAAIASITHRVTGLVLFFTLLGLVYLLELGLSSPAGFDEARGWLAQVWVRLALLGLLAALAYHFFAGIKHMLLDFHLGDTLQGARAGSIAVFVLTALCVAALGVWLW